jgi:DNA-binding protein Fis
MTQQALTEYAHEYLDTLCNYCGESLGNVRGLHDTVMDQVERPLIENLMKYLNGNQVKAAQVLGINRNTLRKRLKK